MKARVAYTGISQNSIVDFLATGAKIVGITHSGGEHFFINFEGNPREFELLRLAINYDFGIDLYSSVEDFMDVWGLIDVI